MAEVKHGGCFDCKTKNQEILRSTAVFGEKATSVACCDACFGRRQEEAKNA